MTTVPTWNNGIYLCLYHLPHVCRTLVPEIRISPEILRVFRYIDVLMCMIYNRTQRMTGATRVCREDYQRRQVGECTDTGCKKDSATETVEL